MIGVDEARARVRERALPLEGVEEIALGRALGRVLHAPVHADRDDPPFDRSMMDGYAVRAAETPGTLRRIAAIAAGADVLPEVARGCAAWINTGAPLPPGADAVVPVEDTRGKVDVEVLARIAPGANILRRAALVRAGDPLVDGRLTPEAIAVCAAAGADPVSVRRLPRVAVFATGSELERAPGPHQIRNSNGPMLLSLLAAYGPADLGVVEDRPEETARAVARGLEADVLVTTGGISKGELDLVRPALEGAGVSVVFHGVALQPGKPLLFGEHPNGFVFALPGNPASALVCADLFLLPFLAALSGRRFEEVLLEVPGRLRAAVGSSDRRRRVFPCIRRGEAVEPLPWRSSADLYTLARASAYLVVEPGQDLAAGDEVRTLIPERFAARTLRS